MIFNLHLNHSFHPNNQTLLSKKKKICFDDSWYDSSFDVFLLLQVLEIKGQWSIHIIQTTLKVNICWRHGVFFFRLLPWQNQWFCCRWWRHGTNSIYNSSLDYTCIRVVRTYFVYINLTSWPHLYPLYLNVVYCIFFFRLLPWQNQRFRNGLL